MLMSTSIDVDYIYAMGSARLQALRTRSVTGGSLATGLVRAMSGLLSEGRDGELFVDWPEGQDWLAEALGLPDRVQVGGTGAQAAWALDLLGAPTLMSLESQSPEQLCVLAPSIFVCRQGRTMPVHEVTADADAKPVHNWILEFPSGSGMFGNHAERAIRVILRFSPIHLERDEQFMAMQRELAPKAGAALLSGLNGLDLADRACTDWAGRLLAVWREWGPDVRHLELGDTTSPGHLKTILAGLRGLSSSLGLSLSELFTFWGSSAEVAAKALDVALMLECPCLVVHADRWSLAVHRGDAGAVVRRLMTGNLLASARAAAGAPVEQVAPVSNAIYAADVPRSGPLDGGWRVDCVPAPFVPRPVSTIGLGDTFTAGVLLAAALECR